MSAVLPLVWKFGVQVRLPKPDASTGAAALMSCQVAPLSGDTSTIAVDTGLGSCARYWKPASVARPLVLLTSSMVMPCPPVTLTV